MKRDQPNLHAPDVSAGRRRFLQTGAALAGGLLLEIHATGIGIRSARAASITDSTAGSNHAGQSGAARRTQVR